MCGICGWVGRAPDLKRLEAAQEHLRHRGPEGNGHWTGEGVMLGHTRLRVIDLSEAADQPMSNEDGRIQATFNGEIYNFKKLRAELIRHHRFRSSGDTEVLVHGYEEWGIEGLLERIRGMFAFAIWDENRHELHLARDRLGKKPLYIAEGQGGLTFSSTVPALIELLDRTPSVSTRAVADYLIALAVPGERSIFEGVSKLPPGHRATFSLGRLHIEPYWQLSFGQQENHSSLEWVERVDAEIGRAVKDRLVADVPVGVFLSGGVDSSLVAAWAARHSSQPIRTIAAGFTEAPFDERPYARQVASHLGTNHMELLIRPDVAALLPKMVAAVGEPFGDHAFLPTLALAEAVREHVTVVLTGDGGDESFAGYPSALVGRFADPYMRLLPTSVRRSLARQLRRLPANRPVRHALRVAIPAQGERFLWRYDPLAQKGFRGMLDQILTDQWLQRLQGPDVDALWDTAFERSDGPSTTDRILDTELRTLLPDQFLVKTDRATMAWSLEARSPLLDSDLVALAARIPARQKLRALETKSLLRRVAERHLPVRLTRRPKQGFSVPTSEWMRGPLRSLARQILLSDVAVQRGVLRPSVVRRLLDDHACGRADHGQRLWTLLQLELWFLMFTDRQLKSEDVLQEVKKS